MKRFNGYTAEEIMLAHQFLYYCGPALGLSPIWSDYHYDLWCKEQGLESNGGSDSPSSYVPKVIVLAEIMHIDPTAYPHDLEVK